jgi:integrase
MMAAWKGTESMDEAVTAPAKAPVRNKPTRAKNLASLKQRLPPRVAVIDGGSKLRVFYRPRGKDAGGARFATSSLTVEVDPDNPDAALDEVNQIRKAVREGRHPGQERRQAVAGNIADRLDAVDDGYKRYAEWLPRRPLLRGSKSGKLKFNTAKEELAHLRRAIESARLGSRPIASLGKADITRIHDACIDEPHAWRHRYNAVNKFCDKLMGWGLVKQNPCLLLDKTERPRAGGQRTVKPSLAALATLWKAAPDLPYDAWRDLALTLFGVPLRRNEAAGLRYEYIDFNNATLTLPDKITKTGSMHALHLHPLIFDILKRRHNAMGEPAEGLVFPAPRTGKQIVAFSALKRAIDRLAPEIK